LLNQSFYFVLLQIINLIVGLFITLYVAINVDPKIFAILTILLITTSLMSAFTFLGYETVLIRNVLYWDSKGNKKKIKNLVTYAIISRVFISILLFIPLACYLYYISEVNYAGEYYVTFLSFIVVGVFTSVSNSNGLILRAFNRYALSFSITVIGNLLGKLISIVTFIHFGFMPFIFVLITVPILICLISLYFIRDLIDLRMFRFKYAFKFRRYKFFAVAGYLKYVIGYVDRIIVSLLLPIELLASYSLAKQVQEIGKSFIEGFFDPIIQKVVSLKNKTDELRSFVLRLNLIRRICFLLALLVSTPVIIYMPDIVTLGGVGKYQYLADFIRIAIVSSLVYLGYKVEGNIISLFMDQFSLFKIDVLIALISILSIFAVSYLLDDKWIFLNRLVIDVFMYFVFYKYWKNFSINGVKLI
jgi:O-antigen/teichoic acid export membrane protein